MGHVLYVEDASEMRQSGAAILAGAGHTVGTAGTAAEALAYCEGAADAMSAVIIDLHWAEIGAGIKLAGQIAMVSPGAAVTAFSGGIRSLPPAMPATVRLLPKPMGVAAFFEAADATAESAILRPCRSWSRPP